MVNPNYFNIVFNVTESIYASWINLEKLLWREVGERFHMDNFFDFLDYSELKSIRNNDIFGPGVLEVSLKFTLKIGVKANAEQQDEFYDFFMARFNLPIVGVEGYDVAHRICCCIHNMEYVEPVDWSSEEFQQDNSRESFNPFSPKNP